MSSRAWRVSLLVGALVVGGAVSLLWPSDATDPRALRGAISLQYPSVAWVTTTQLVDWMADADRALVLLDVRAEAEYQVSHLRGARRLDPDDPEVPDLPAEATVVVYCSVGYRSAVAAERIAAAGHGQVFNLEGGLFAWANDGGPLFLGDAPADRVHPYDALWGTLLRPELRAPLP